MSKEMWSQVNEYRDGESLNAENLNVPVFQLGDRTMYLYNRIKAFMDGGPMSAVILTNVGIGTGEGSEPEEGNVVYLNNETGLFAKAKASMSLYDDFKAADSAFTVGILRKKDGASGDVVIYGNMNLNPDGSAIMASNILEKGEKFRPGRYYLSSNEAGKLTSDPTGPRIYVCTISGSINTVGGMSGAAIINPQFLDIGTSHVHRTATLTARPAGTDSTAGYLPIDETTPDGMSGPLALRFGGTWTADRKVDYKFYITQSSPDWPDGVVLKWTEDGEESEDFKVTIPAPNIDVQISNGLTARLSTPSSTSVYAFSALPERQRTWETMTFPDAGMGWIDHEGYAVAENDDIEGLKVSLRGRFDESNLQVKVAFPESVGVYDIGEVSEGKTVSCGGVTYIFVSDPSSYSSSQIRPIQIGTCQADSLAYLVSEMNEHSGPSMFAVFEEREGSSSSSSGGGYAYLVVINGSGISVDGTAASAMSSSTGESFDVGDDDITLVVFDKNGIVLTETPFVTNVESYVWKDAGDISVIVYQNVSTTVSVPAGTVVTGIAVDDEPDALYDYVIGMDGQISKYWPPVPPKSAALIVNGVEMDNKALVKSNPTVSFGPDTIHWFEDDSGRKPWPEAFRRRDAKIDPALDKAEVMHWVRGFQGSTGPVTSIQVKPGSPLKIYGYGTFDEANTGDLEIAADFDFSIGKGDVPGYLVPKRAMSGKLIAGPVVERIVGGAGINVISKAGCPSGQGTVVVSLDNGTYGSQFSDIALENAEQSKIGMFPYIRLRGYSGSTITSPSAFTATVRVPTNLPDIEYSMRVTASVFGENGFSGVFKSACVKFAYNILPDFSASGDMKYSDLKTGLLKPDNDRTVIIPFGHQTDNGIVYNGFDPVLISTTNKGLEESSDIVEKVIGRDIPSAEEFDVQGIVPSLKPGYLVGIRISRAVTQGFDVEPYTDAIGFINLSWSLVAAE